MYEEGSEPRNAVSTKTESSKYSNLIRDTARALIRRAKQASRRRFPTEEKIRVLLEGVRGSSGGGTVASRGHSSDDLRQVAEEFLLIRYFL